MTVEVAEDAAGDGGRVAGTEAAVTGLAVAGAGEDGDEGAPSPDHIDVSRAAAAAKSARPMPQNVVWVASLRRPRGRECVAPRDRRDRGPGAMGGAGMVAVLPGAGGVGVR